MISFPLLSPRKASHYRNLIAAIALAALFLSPFVTQRVLALPPPAPSTTVLATSGATATLGTAVTLTATVTSISNPVTPGVVQFCDTSASFCEGTALLGSAQLTSAGTASIKLMLGLGAHTIKAFFPGTNSIQPSSSTSSTITVGGSSPTSTAVATTGSAGDYTLTATLGYHGLTTPVAAETITFVDASNLDLDLGEATLSSASAATYGFTTIATSPVATGNFPASVVVADFNGDGFPDVAIANYTANSVSIFAGDGLGGFNGDGRPDIAVANAHDATISILLGISGGSFTVSGTVAVGSGPQSIAVADFNDDGNADLAVANLLDSTISILLGSGAGTFAAGSTVSAYTGNNPNAIVAADFNNDGNADLAIANASDGTVTVLNGSGGGGFTAMTGSPFAISSYPVALVAADLNNDGLPDLAIVSGTTNKVAIRLNTGSGFSTPSGSPYSTGSSPSAIVATDANNDGSVDLVISNANDSTCTVLLGNGTGAFTAAPASPLANFSAPISAAIGDVNGDGTHDLIVTNAGANSFSTRPVLVTQAAIASLSSVSIPGSGTHQITARYSGDSSYGASASPSSPLTGTRIATTTTLAITPGATVTADSNPQITATICPSHSSNFIANGTVNFFDGSTEIGHGTLTAGQAQMTISSLKAGVHSLTATYAGSTDFATSTSAATKLTGTDFAVAATPATQTVLPGQSGTFKIGITPETGGFSNAVTFAVTGLPSGATAKFSPATVTPGSAATSTTLTVTLAATAASSADVSNQGPQLAFLLIFLPLAGLGSLRKNIRSASVSVATLVLLIAGALYLGGCGSHQTTAAHTLTVTASSGQLTHATSITLNVH